MSTGLSTDRYELTMVASALQSGTAEIPCVFEVFARSLPPGRRYGVLAGIGRIQAAVDTFRFSEEDLAYLEGVGMGDEVLNWCRSYEFGGEILGYREGELWFPNSPVLTVVAPFAQAVVLETLLLSILNFDSAIASAAARMVIAANGKALLEMGGRHIHESAAVDAARAAYVAGFSGTSNLEAGRRYGVPTIGTSAHAFVLLHPTERDSFVAQIATHGTDTTLLVDTYDIETGIENAIDVAGRSLQAIRIDSGDLVAESVRARAQLDQLGATKTKIVVSGDLNEFELQRLQGAPIDAFGVGTNLVTGAGAPTSGFVYKVVAVQGHPGGEFRPVSKASKGKETVGGRKYAFRHLDDHDRAVGEVLTMQDDNIKGRPLQQALDAIGWLSESDKLNLARDQLQASLAELPDDALLLDAGPPAITTSVIP